MAAAATAAVSSARLVGEPTTVAKASVVMLGALVAGAIEGGAVGELQYRVFRTWIPQLRRRRYVGVTVVLAVLFWFLGMLPSTLMALAGNGESAEASPDPPLFALVLVAAAGGALGGLAFGVFQGWALRGQVRFPWRWVRPNVVGWALAVVVITVGAASAPSGWPVLGVAGYGVCVGILAGAVVGVVTGQALPALDLDLPWWNRVVADLLLSPAHRMLSGGVMLLRFRGWRSGKMITLPVQYVRVDDATVCVFVANADHKNWWRTFSHGQPAVSVRLRGRTISGTGHLLTPGQADHEVAAAAYRAKQPRVDVSARANLAAIRLGGRDDLPDRDRSVPTS